jgi:hypothetical protein
MVSKYQILKLAQSKIAFPKRLFYNSGFERAALKIGKASG